jgi:hypothetical protein
MGFDTDAYDPVAHDIDRPGTLSLADARELRLDYAQRLEDDVLGVRSLADD